jgi:hypothetical protein
LLGDAPGKGAAQVTDHPPPVPLPRPALERHVRVPVRQAAVVAAPALRVPGIRPRDRPQGDFAGAPRRGALGSRARAAA